MQTFPFLSSLIFLPLAAAVGLFAFKAERARWLALGCSLIELAVSVALLGAVDPQTDHMQLVERHSWIPSLNVQYLVGVDGVAAPFLPLTALLTVAVILASWNGLRQMPRLYYALLLALQGITIGVYCAIDLILFFLFWELTLVPIFFLICRWGIGAHRRHAATQYTLMMLTGGALLLIGFVLLALNGADDRAIPAPAGLSFDYTALLDSPIPIGTQSVIFLLLFFGFAFKAPLFPFHVWLPTLAMEGPIGITALLMGLKLGAFGIIRFAVPLAPQAAARFSTLMAALGLVGAIYGALLALRQSNLRRLLAYASVSHVGFVVIGIAALNLQGIQGAVLQLLNFATIAGGLMLIAGFLHQRFASTDLTHLGGVAKTAPLLTTLFFMLGLASMGVPGTSGFPAENLILVGTFRSHFSLGLAALFAVILGAAYFLCFFRRAFLGPSTQAGVIVDLRRREWLIAGSFVFIMLLSGLSPQTILDFSRKSLQAWVSRLDNVDPMTLAAVRHDPASVSDNIEDARR